MHFRLTARDGVPAGGGIDYDDVTLRIDPKAGPFLVTLRRRQGVTVERGGSRRRSRGRSTAPGRWPRSPDPAVHRRRQDLDRAWRKTANDGSAKVRFPSVNAAKARIMI